VATLADQPQDRRGLGRVTEVVQEQTGGLFVENSERAQDQGPDGRCKVRMIAGQLPVARDATPDGVGLDSLGGIVQVESGGRVESQG
jgi:hypothetical protein